MDLFRVGLPSQELASNLGRVALPLSYEPFLDLHLWSCFELGRLLWSWLQIWGVLLRLPPINLS